MPVGYFTFLSFLVVYKFLDSDTVVPEDCFRDAAREMGEEGGESVGIIQHESGKERLHIARLVTHDFV